MAKGRYKGIISFTVLLLSVSFIVFLVITLFNFYPASGKRSVSDIDDAVNTPVEKQATPVELAKDGNANEPHRPLEMMVETSIVTGDTIYDLLKGLGVSPKEVLSITSSSKGVFNLRKILPGRILRATLLDGKLQRLEYPINDSNLLIIEGQYPDFQSSKKEIEFDKGVVLAEGRIENSLYEDGLKRGLDPEIIMALADVFAWEIDFAVDLRKGDSFKVLYEESSLRGEVVKRGPVLAAQFMNSGETFTAIYFKDSNGKGDFYDLDGKSLRKQFLKSPLNYRRISSYFSKRRYHPISKTYKPHHGIDYAAPYGTPIVAAGDGRIVFSGWKRGYGRFIVIRHNSTYSTAYGHLSSISRKAKKNRLVKQGQIIGYVGSSGISTGPHLHYEFRVRGKSVNPLRVKFPSAQPVKKRFQEKFDIVKETLLMALKGEDKGIEIARRLDVTAHQGL
ncbi:MAG: peptidoglycan DD-metalloendopeptidase family protein [Thermodesulfobacteriota bacterium]